MIRIPRAVGMAVVACMAAALPAGRTFAQEVVTDDRPAFTFEDVTNWKGLTIDRKLVHEGKQSGAWEGTLKNDRAKYQSKTLDLSGYNAVRLWIYSKKATNASIAFALLSEDERNDGPDFYFCHIKIDFEGWKEITIPFKDLKIRRSPQGMNQISELSFATTGYGLGQPDPDTALRFDDLRFITLEGEPNGPPLAQPPVAADATATPAPPAPTATPQPSPRPAAGPDGTVVPTGYEAACGFEDVTLWKGLAADTESPVEGQFSGRWENMMTITRIDTRSFPHDVSGYRSMVFSIWSSKAGDTQIALVLTADNPATDMVDYYMTHIPVTWTGWKEVTVPFSQMRKEYSPLGLDTIGTCRFASTGYKIKRSSPDLILKLDNIRFFPLEAGSGS